MKLAGTRILQAKDSQEYDKLSDILVKQGYEPMGPAQVVVYPVGEHTAASFFWQEWHKKCEPSKISQVSVVPTGPVV